MSKKPTCSVCGNEKSPFVMNLKQVCLACDELLFDMEIETDDEHLPAPQENPKNKDSRKPLKLREVRTLKKG